MSEAESMDFPSTTPNQRRSFDRGLFALLYCCSFGLAVAPVVALMAKPIDLYLPHGCQGAAAASAFWIGIPWGIAIAWLLRRRRSVSYFFLIAEPILAVFFLSLSKNYARLAKENRGGFMGGFGEGIASMVCIVAAMWCIFWLLTGLFGLIYLRLLERELLQMVDRQTQIE